MDLRIGVIAIIVLVVATVSGCSTLAYYGQSVRGQWQIIRLAQPIEEVVADKSTDPNLRAKLERILSMREFAVSELDLPDNASYRRYADLGRSHVVWNVFAAPELSVEPVTWCFPIVGCLVYRGYFRKQDAIDFATGLKAEGYDTMVGGISAYSTLGWFKDPVLNTFIGRSDAELAGLIFHELTHQVIYIKDDSVFNESLATAVELEGMRRWLASEGNAERMALETQRLERHYEIIELLLTYRDKLSLAYAAPISDDEKRADKRTILDELRNEYRRLAEQWQSDDYNGWFAGELNNARFISAAAYHSRVPAFTALIQESATMREFWQRVRGISEMPPSERDRVLDALTESVDSTMTPDSTQSPTLADG